MTRRVFAYECYYCGQLFKNPKIAIRHEAACLKNPDAKNCTLCQFSYISGNDKGRYCKIKNCRCTKAVSGNCDEFKKR